MGNISIYCIVREIEIRNQSLLANKKKKKEEKFKND